MRGSRHNSCLWWLLRWAGVADVWRAAGSACQEGMGWPRQRWIDQFPPHAARFALLLDRLGRPVVGQACLRAADSPADAERSFLTVMAGGSGRAGYGPFRVRRVLDATPDASGRVQAAASQAAGAHGAFCGSRWSRPWERWLSAWLSAWRVVNPSSDGTSLANWPVGSVVECRR